MRRTEAYLLRCARKKSRQGKRIHYQLREKLREVTEERDCLSVMVKKVFGIKGKKI